MNIRYSRSLYLQMMLIIALLGLLIFFLKLNNLSSEQHAKRVDVLLQLRELDAKLDQVALELLTSSLVQYDSLVPLYEEIEQTTGRITGKEAAYFGGMTAEIEQTAAEIGFQLRQKQELLEQMKTNAALVRNSLLYLPTLSNQLNDHPFRYVIEPHDLVVDMIGFNRLGSRSSRDSLLAKLSLVDRWVKNHSEDELLKNFQNHIRFNLSVLDKIEQTQKVYLAIPTDKVLEKFRSQYFKYYTAEVDASKQLGFNLMVACVLLGIVIIYILHRLDKSRRETQKASELLHDAVEQLSEGFALYSADGHLKLVNNRWLELYGIASQEEMPSTLAEFNSHEFGKVATDDMEYDESTGLQQRLQKTVTDRWLQVSDTPTSEGGLACVRVDVTEFKKAEHQLLLLGRAVEQSPTSIVITGVEGFIEYVNPKFEQVTGYTEKEVIGLNPNILKSGYTSQGDYESLWNTLCSGEEWRGTFYNQKKDGSFYWEAASISPIRDKSGVITNFLAVKEDITKQKLANDELKAAAAVFEATQEGIMTTDPELQITAVNSAFTVITGYSEAEVIGKTPAILSSGKHDRLFYEEMWNKLKTEGRWFSEVWNKRKDGSLYPQWLSISVIHDEAGEVLQYVAVITDKTEMKKHEDQIHMQAYYDSLTELPNRSLLMDRIDHDLKLASRNNYLSSLLFIDLDRFKRVNDTMGHEIGDCLLVKVAERLRSLVRGSDTISRFGGDEFVILLSDISGENHAAQVAEKIIEALKEPFVIEGYEIFSGASIGISMSPSDSMDALELLRLADMAMYKAKESGRNQYHFFAQSMQEKVHRRVHLEQKLRSALEQGNLQVFYQPIIHTITGDVFGVEALARWFDPEEGAISPVEFIPVAEESGLISELGEVLLEQACRDIHGLEVSGIPLHLSVNISSRQYDLGFNSKKLAPILESTGFSGSRLSLELTESILLDDDVNIKNWLTEFCDLGVKLSIDDFGTGYSSLSYLKRFPISTLKIDRAFIADLQSRDDTSLVNTIVSMADSMSMDVIAEGVETDSQLQTLAQLKCTYVQGFYYSEPVAVDDLKIWLTTR